jgi:hypothetical protein
MKMVSLIRWENISDGYANMIIEIVWVSVKKASCTPCFF